MQNDEFRVFLLIFWELIFVAKNSFKVQLSFLKIVIRLDNLLTLLQKLFLVSRLYFIVVSVIRLKPDLAVARG